MYICIYKYVYMHLYLYLHIKKFKKCNDNLLLFVLRFCKTSLYLANMFNCLMYYTTFLIN